MDRDTAIRITNLIRLHLPESASFRLEEELETPLVDFHHWADGKDCIGAFRVASAADELHLLFIQWSPGNHPSRVAFVAYTPNRLEVVFEVHEVRDNHLRWTYRPVKHDGRNAERKARFDALAPQRGLPFENSRVSFPVPENPADVEAFLSTAFLLADVRGEANDLPDEQANRHQGDAGSPEPTAWDTRRNQIRDGIVSDGSFDVLRSFATWIADEQPARDAATAWLAEELSLQPGTARAEIDALKRAGLLSEINDHLTCTQEVALWSSDHTDTTAPVRIVHGRIRFIGELLSELGPEGKTTRETLAIAREHYGFEWVGGRMVEIRLAWLRAAGLVAADEHGAHHITPTGTTFLRSLPLQPRLGHQDSSEPRYWLMALGPRAMYWDECRREGIACLGWDEIGDISEYAGREDIGLGRNDSLACWQFCHDMEPGDIIFAKRGTTDVVGHGTVASGYRFDVAREAYKNVRDVDWLSNFPTGVLVHDRRLVMKTLTDVSDYPDLVDDLKRAVGILQPRSVVQVEPEPTYSVDSILEDGCFLARAELDGFLTRLKTKKNLVLQGPPGTGKTWLAKRLAYALIGHRDRERICTVQFHPTLSYEDFVLGWRPTANGQLELTKGIFLRAIESASADPATPFVVVIEEINRGNPAQIFGELITLLEADKRSEDEALELSYATSDGPWRVHVPDNLHVVGTMNIADRSLALVDLALRRRFAFATLKPRIDGTWHRWVTERLGVDAEAANDIRRRMAALNEAIGKSLGEQFCVGHSYVTPVAAPEDVNGWFRDVVETELAPLLEEYWFDDAGRAKQERDRLLANL